MKIIFFSFLLVCNYASVNSQTTADSVYFVIIGRFVAPIDTFGYAVTMGFKESHHFANDTIKLLGIAQSVTLFHQKIATAGIDSSGLKPMLDAFIYPTREKRYVFTHKSASVVDKVVKIARELNIIIYNHSVVLKEQTLASQYIKATLALKDAKDKAKIFADHLNLKIDKIISIDDVTSDRIVNTGNPYTDRYKAEYKSFVRELEILISTGYSDIYTLKVKFLLLKN